MIKKWKTQHIEPEGMCQAYFCDKPAEHGWLVAEQRVFGDIIKKVFLCNGHMRGDGKLVIPP